MVLGLPCQFDYRDVTYAFHRTFGHLLPRRLQNRDIINGAYDTDRYAGDNHPPTPSSGYNTSTDQIGRIQAREHEQITAGNVSGTDMYYPGGREDKEKNEGSHVRRKKKEVGWDQGVVGGSGEGRGGTGSKDKRMSISRAV
ncbi:hypothetical protein TWF106_009538 [Orbilia oligospora]|uniref:Uncharacterized protein n=1 Tax=Orbilia oligospora TaxID=2813651 RepID=A0A6G1MLJ3_ORBOL|nr:hypothetical protein TWF788_007505 [Orbilia oligospora]KAF3213158.1 hypothetical protein TWF679_005384 [Orbilia oligospora]KAF3213411.1 hypothetical protein TWF106_009538 [Orbilia oligospora]KAF3229952.1 hypothetical protein TWF191_000855 [Orbilia oligospora]KAF3260590.1 hypothetical protein TWF192_009871 [Orbilia oligospora]